MDSWNEIRSLLYSILLYSQKFKLQSSTIWLPCLLCTASVCVCINHAYTSVLITPNVAAPSKTQEMTFLSLFLYTINHP